jgi:nicotinamide-nucleotide amidase
MIPEGARAIDNPLGTAPGVRLSIGGAQAFFFAGVPREFRALCRGELFGFLDERAGGAPPPRCRVIKTLGMAESAIAHSLRGLEQAFPDVRVGYRPVFPENHLRLYAAGERAAERVLEAEQEIRRRLGETVIFGVDGEEFAWAVGQALRTAGLTLATAESCTGGLAASMITAVPGSSDYFVGGCVAYSNGLKERLLGVSRWTLDRHGAVSREAVLEMASGARERMGAGLAVSVSGVAGPAGGTAEKPVGLVHFALAGPAGAHAIARRFPGDRAMVQRAAAYTALELVRREALGLPRARPE